MEESNEKKSYEISFLSKNEEGIGEISKLLKSFGAEIQFESPVSKINLAYAIQKETKAHSGYFHFVLEPSKIKEVEHTVNIHPSLLRFLIVTPPFLKEKTRHSLPPKRRLSALPPAVERKEQLPLSNEALERQLKEILQ